MSIDSLSVDSLAAEEPQRPAVSRRKTTLVNLFFQYIAVAIALTHGLVFTPMYVHFLGKSLYGAWLASGDILYWAIIAQAGAAYLLTQQTAHLLAQKSLKELGEVVGSGLVLLALFSSIGAAIAVGLAPFVPSWFKVVGLDASQLTIAMVLAAVSMWMRLFCTGTIAIAQGYQRPMGAGLINNTFNVVHLIVTAVLLWYGYGLISLPIGMIVRDLLCLMGMSIYLWFTNRSLGVKFRPSPAGIRALSHLSAWNFLACLNDALVFATTPLFVGLILGTGEATVVNVSRAMWELLNLLLLQFINGLQPGLAHLKGEGDESGVTRIANQVLLIAFSAFVVGAAVLWAFNAEFVRLWMGTQFYAGATFNILYGLATAFSILTIVVCQVTLSIGEIRGSSLCRTAVQGTRVLAMVVLLAPFGVWAVPIAALVSLALVGFLLLRLWQSSVLRANSIPWDGLMRGARLLVFGAAAGAASNRFLHPTNWVELAISIVITTLAVSFCVLFAEPTLITTAKQALATALRRPQVTADN